MGLCVESGASKPEKQVRSRCVRVLPHSSTVLSPRRHMSMANHHDLEEIRSPPSSPAVTLARQIIPHQPKDSPVSSPPGSPLQRPAAKELPMSEAYASIEAGDSSVIPQLNWNWRNTKNDSKTFLHAAGLNRVNGVLVDIYALQLSTDTFHACRASSPLLRSSSKKETPLVSHNRLCVIPLKMLKAGLHCTTQCIAVARKPSRFCSPAAHRSKTEADRASTSPRCAAIAQWPSRSSNRSKTTQTRNCFSTI
jgi:hypothetical protein